MRIGRGVLARRREEPAAAAHLRHRLGDQGGARGAPDRLEEAERRDHRKLGRELDLFCFPDEIGSGLAVFHPKGGVIKREMEDYVRRRHIEEGFSVRRHAAHHQGGAVPHLGPPAVLRRHACSRPMELEGANYYLKAMNCPMHNLIYRSRGRSYRELPLRLFEFGVGLPLREVRRRPRPDPGARHDPGRLALLRHRRAGAGRDQAPARLRARPAARLRPRRLLPRAVDPRRRATRTSSSAPTRSGRSRPRSSRRSRTESGLDAGARPGRRGVLRPEDLGAGARRDRPHLADVDDPVRLQPARAASAWSTRPPTARASSR